MSVKRLPRPSWCVFLVSPLLISLWSFLLGIKHVSVCLDVPLVVGFGRGRTVMLSLHQHKLVELTGSRLLVRAQQIWCRLCLSGWKWSMSQSTGIKADVVGCLEDADRRWYCFVFSSPRSLPVPHSLFSRAVFVLGFRILTRRHSVPWKSSWHIVHMVVQSPVREKEGQLHMSAHPDEQGRCFASGQHLDEEKHAPALI